VAFIRYFILFAAHFKPFPFLPAAERANKSLFLDISGTFCVLVSFPFIFLPCVGCSESSQWAQVLYFAGFVIIFQFGWAAVQVSHLSLIPVLAHDEHARTDLTAFRYSGSICLPICPIFLRFRQLISSAFRRR
jgi:Na+/melibiose symporter-like transporter